jgi:hypothetical protein
MIRSCFDLSLLLTQTSFRVTVMIRNRKIGSSRVLLLLFLLNIFGLKVLDLFMG